MGAKTEIAWTDSTWTPIRARVKEGPLAGHVGPHCERVSQGCVNCYSETNNGRCLPANGTGLPFNRQSRDKVDIFVDEKILTHPLHWKAARRIFVCSQTDLFGEWVTDEMIDRVFAVMALCPQHTFQVLTKRAERMQKYADKASAGAFLDRCAGEKYLASYPQHKRTAWPLPNVWLGVSCEDQKTADERIPLLLQTPAAVRFVSLEPLLGAISLRWMSAWPGSPHGAALKPTGDTNHLDGLRLLDWVIAGGESGPGARPMHPDWVRGIRDQCVAAKVPFFFKQWGEYGPTYRSAYAPASSREPKSAYPWGGGIYSPRLGKRAASHLLDGREYRQLPKGLTHV